MQDYYRTLDVAPTASHAQIKAAYRRQAQLWHPDRHPDDVAAATRRFQDIGEAFRTLSSPRLRQLYDEARAATTTPRPPEERAPSPPPPRSDGDALHRFMEAWAERMVATGRDARSVAEGLVRDGLSPDEAWSTVDRARRRARRPHRMPARIAWALANLPGLRIYLVVMAVLVTFNVVAHAWRALGLDHEENGAALERLLPPSLVTLPATPGHDDFTSWRERPLLVRHLLDRPIAANRTVHLFALVPDRDPFDCAHCAPLVAALVTAGRGRDEHVEAPLTPLVQLGGYGRYDPPAGSPRLVDTGPHAKALVLDDQVTLGDTLWDWHVFIAIDADAPRAIGDLVGGAHGLRAGCDQPPHPTCSTLAVSFRFVSGPDADHHRLESTLHGTVVDRRDGRTRTFDETRASRFDGARYPDVWDLPL